jgi:hypothetical protein
VPSLSAAARSEFAPAPPLLPLLPLPPPPPANPRASAWACVGCDESARSKTYAAWFALRWPPPYTGAPTSAANRHDDATAPPRAALPPACGLALAAGDSRSDGALSARLLALVPSRLSLLLLLLLPLLPLLPLLLLLLAPSLPPSPPSLLQRLPS